VTDGLRSYLVRHGPAGPAAQDHLRPLTAAGRALVEEIAREAQSRGIHVAEIRHSGLLRARQTAEILADRLQVSRRIVETTGLQPEDDPEVARAELAMATEPLMLVGHLPHLARLAGLLVAGDAGAEPVTLVPATVVGLVRGARAWTIDLVLTPGGGRPG
jgi:phosphohistidine phosphatase